MLTINIRECRATLNVTLILILESNEHFILIFKLLKLTNDRNLVKINDTAIIKCNKVGWLRFKAFQMHRSFCFKHVMFSRHT